MHEAPNAVLQFADHYHLLPLAFAFIVLGMISAYEMIVASCFRAHGSLAEKYYDCKMQWLVRRRRYEEEEAGKGH